MAGPAHPDEGVVTDIEAEARRDERANIVAWLRQEAARYRWLEPTLSPAARALESVAYLIETHAPHTSDETDDHNHAKGKK